MRYYINNFYIFSIIGYFLESIFFHITNYSNESGFLYLWWTPFYGVGVIIAILSYKLFDKYIKNKFIKLILLTVFLFIILTLTELLGALLLKLTNIYSLWSYDDFPLNIGHYISIPSSLAWVFMSFLYLFIIKKYSDLLINKIPKWLTVFLTLVFITDIICTSMKIFAN